MEKKILPLVAVFVALSLCPARAAEPFVCFTPSADAASLTGRQGAVRVDAADWRGVHIAAENLRSDLRKVAGRDDVPVTVGTLGRSKTLDRLGRLRTADGTRLRTLWERELRGRREKFLVTWTDEAGLVIAGSDKRGTIYGIYELSEQLGVSPWWDWADVPVEQHTHIYIKKHGAYTDGEPAVRYRGIFLNDEAPCLSGWVRENYGGVYDHRFYARVFELVLRLRGNFMWPAMWSSAFYADDPENLRTADDMGVMMGTSHHEPMARAHQEWRRMPGRGAWNFDENRQQLETFWRGGVERMRETEDVVTIGMRGDGDEPMGKNADVALLERIVGSQRTLIEQATGRPADETPQVWALYKEVQEYYEKGMQVPDDVILLLCDDNWGNVRVLPTAGGEEPTGTVWDRRHPGGYGMYYHVDYVGGPRNSKTLNVTQVQRMWEQLALTYAHGVDQLWILNVGDLKPMELPIDFWFRMAWRPDRFRPDNLMAYTEAFCRQQLGDKCAREAARLLTLQSQYAHRRTPELLSAHTFSLASGEWQQRVAEYDQLERDATILRDLLPPSRRTTYAQLIYTPVRLMANLYRMYYAQARNHALAATLSASLSSASSPASLSSGSPLPSSVLQQGCSPASALDSLASLVSLCFRRDRELCDDYNHRLASGKWNHLMDEVHIGYTSWNGPRENLLPQVFRSEDLPAAITPSAASGSPTTATPGSPSTPNPSAAPSHPFVLPASSYLSSASPEGTSWHTIPHYGIHADAVTLLPPTAPVRGASLTYAFTLPLARPLCGDGVAAPSSSPSSSPSSLTLVFAPTFPYNGGVGHRLSLLLDGQPLLPAPGELNINDAAHHVCDGYRDQNYQWEITRENRHTIPLPPLAPGTHTLTLLPLTPGIVLEQVELNP